MTRAVCVPMDGADACSKCGWKYWNRPLGGDYECSSCGSVLEPTLFEGPIVTKTGRILTDADIEALADEAERGYDVAPPTITEADVQAFDGEAEGDYIERMQEIAIMAAERRVAEAANRLDHVYREWCDAHDDLDFANDVLRRARRRLDTTSAAGLIGDTP